MLVGVLLPISKESSDEFKVIGRTAPTAQPPNTRRTAEGEGGGGGCGAAPPRPPSSSAPHPPPSPHHGRHQRSWAGLTRVSMYTADRYLLFSQIFFFKDPEFIKIGLEITSEKGQGRGFMYQLCCRARVLYSVKSFFISKLNFKTENSRGPSGTLDSKFQNRKLTSSERALFTHNPQKCIFK